MPSKLIIRLSNVEVIGDLARNSLKRESARRGIGNSQV